MCSKERSCITITISLHDWRHVLTGQTLWATNCRYDGHWLWYGIIPLHRPALLSRPVCNASTAPSLSLARSDDGGGDDCATICGGGCCGHGGINQNQWLLVKNTSALLSRPVCNASNAPALSLARLKTFYREAFSLHKSSLHFLSGWYQILQNCNIAM